MHLLPPPHTPLRPPTPWASRSDHYAPPTLPRLQERLAQLVQRLEAVERTRAAQMQTRVGASEAARLCDSEEAGATPRSFLGASPVLPRSAAAVELTRALASLSSLAPVPPPAHLL